MKRDTQTKRGTKTKMGTKGTRNGVITGGSDEDDVRETELRRGGTTPRNANDDNSDHHLRHQSTAQERARTKPTEMKPTISGMGTYRGSSMLR